MSAILSITRWALVALVAAVGIACADDSPNRPPLTPKPAGTQPTSTLPPASTPEPRTELRVAFINLYSPLSSLDDDSGAAKATFEERLGMVIAELKELDPDVVAFNDVSWTEETGSALSRLASELRMEFQYARSSPWLPGQTKEESDALASERGYERGVLVLSREPILAATRTILAWQDAEAGDAYAALHVTVRGPGETGILDIYTAELAGIAPEHAKDATRALISFVLETRGTGPVIVMGSLGIPHDSDLMKLYEEAGLVDVTRRVLGDLAPATCCRESILAPGTPLTERSDFILTDGWLPSRIRYFGHLPHRSADGTMLYASIRNGLMAALPITSAGSVDASGY
ncbi:MAG: hypothetical protein Kow0010_14380 [Dehalococcoidia bacterium]